jgi:hypothetical protein
MRRLLGAFGVATIAAGLVAPPAEAVFISVPCPECDTWPLWLQVLLPLVGAALGLAVLYLPYRLSRTARTPRRRALILVGGVVFLTIGLVVLARVAVLVLPDS